MTKEQRHEYWAAYYLTHREELLKYRREYYRQHRDGTWMTMREGRSAARVRRKRQAISIERLLASFDRFEDMRR